MKGNGVDKAMDFEMFVTLLASAVGIAGGVLLRGLRASGKVAQALGLAPAAGVGLAIAFR